MIHIRPGHRLVAAILVAVGATVPALARQTSQPPPKAPIASVRIDEIKGSAPWLTIVPDGETLSFAMPVEPTVESVREADGSVSTIYECETERVILQVLAAALPDFAVKRRASISPELYARLGFESFLVGFRSELPGATVTFLRAVSQGGMLGGDGFVVAPTLEFPVHVRVLRGLDGRMLILTGIVLDSRVGGDDLERFMASVRQMTDPGERSRLRLGTRELRRIARPVVPATSEPIPELEWEPIAPEGAEFTASMPPLIDDVTTGQLAETGRIKVGGEKYIALSGQMVLMLFISPPGTESREAPRAALESGLRGIVAGLKLSGFVGTPEFEREVTQDGVRGGQGRVRFGEDGGYLQIRVFQTPSRIYVLGAVVYFPTPEDSGTIHRFFDSFRFVRVGASRPPPPAP